MLEKTLMFKCSLLIIRMEENGISNVYIDKLMEKISISFNGTFSIDNIPVFNDDVFSIIINLSKQNEIGTHLHGKNDYSYHRHRNVGRDMIMMNQ